MVRGEGGGGRVRRHVRGMRVRGEGGRGRSALELRMGIRRRMRALRRKRISGWHRRGRCSEAKVTRALAYNNVPRSRERGRDIAGGQRGRRGRRNGETGRGERRARGGGRGFGS